MEEVRKGHFAKLSVAIVELEDKFERDLREMREEKEASLEEERDAHSKTAEELKKANDEREEVETELKERTEELDELKAEHEKCSVLIEEGHGAARKELTLVKTELDVLWLEHDTLKRELAPSKVEKDDLTWWSTRGLPGL